MKKFHFPIFLVFLCMGLGDLAGPLVGLAKDSFHLTNFMAMFICFAGFIMFGILTIPIGKFLWHNGTKLTLLLGLSIAFTAMVIPVLLGIFGIGPELSGVPQYLYIILLLSVLLLGAAMSIFVVAGGAFLENAFPGEESSGDLQWPHLLKVMGASLGFLLPPFAVNYLNLSWTILFPVYAIIISITWLFVSPFKHFDDKPLKTEPASFSSCLGFLSNTRVVLMILGLFLYVGAEVSMFSGLPILLKEKLGITEYGLWIAWLLFFLPLTAGRLLGSFILNWLKPQPFLLISAILSFTGILMLTIGSKVVTFPGIVMAGLGFSNIFRLIFILAERHLPDKSLELRALMATAIAGGAFLPLLMGLIADTGDSIAMGFIAPLFALLYILFLAIISRPEAVMTAQIK